jgi:alcohol dehydrogenase (cytochrome c)
MYYLAETDPRGAMGLGGKEELALGAVSNYLAAIDYKTGKLAWKHEYRSVGGGRASGLLTTAGGLLFGGDVAGNLVAFDASNGRPLWHVYLGTQVSNAPETFLLDGRQYVLSAAGDTLYAFALYE